VGIAEHGGVFFLPNIMISWNLVMMSLNLIQLVSV
jgi:hypothetical protein